MRLRLLYLLLLAAVVALLVAGCGPVAKEINGTARRERRQARPKPFTVAVHNETQGWIAVDVQLDTFRSGVFGVPPKQITGFTVSWLPRVVRVEWQSAGVGNAQTFVIEKRLAVDYEYWHGGVDVYVRR